MIDLHHKLLYYFIVKTKPIIFIFLPFLALTSCSSNKTITFKSRENELETLYDDSYFLLDNSIYHQEIALASQASAISTIKAGKDYENRSSFLVELWEKEGFKDIYINNDFKNQPTDSSIGYAIANKYISLDNEEFNLIAITIRSGHYEAEWASNFNIGFEGNAFGFNEASEKVKAGIYQYLNDYQIKGRTKFWLSGFSRGAITANMAAGKMIDDMENDNFISNIEATNDDIYAYCFETPSGVFLDEDTAKSDLYKGIYNLINMNDGVPQLAPHSFGLRHYGKDYFYPDRLTDIYFDHSERKKLVSNYHFTKGAHNFKEYTVDDWKFFDVGKDLAEKYNAPREVVNPSLGRSLMTLIKQIIDLLQERKMYAQVVQPGTLEFIKAAFGYNKAVRDEPVNPDDMLEIIYSYSFMKNIINGLLQEDLSGFIYDLTILIYQILGFNESNGEAIKEIMSYCFPLLYIVGAAFIYRPELVLQMFNKDNIRSISIGHNTEIGYSFTKSCDSRFYGDKACKLNDGKYKIIRINEPTSFKIYENNLKKDIFLFSNDKMESDTLSAEKFANGNINIFIPNNGDYKYEGEFKSLSIYATNYYGEETLLKEDSLQSGNINN